MESPNWLATSNVLRRIGRRLARKAAALAVKDIVGIVKDSLTAAAIVGAALWFVFQGEADDRVTFVLTQTSVSIADRVTLMAVNVRLTNVGKRPMKTGKIEVRAQQVVPAPPGLQEAFDKQVSPRNETRGAVDWPILDEATYSKSFVIAPTESADVYLELFLPNTIRTVRLYVRVWDEQDRYYWDATSLARVEVGNDNKGALDSNRN